MARYKEKREILARKGPKRDEKEPDEAQGPVPVARRPTTSPKGLSFFPGWAATSESLLGLDARSQLSRTAYLLLPVQGIRNQDQLRHPSGFGAEGNAIEED
jgi:hypothetical protein